MRAQRREAYTAEPANDVTLREAEEERRLQIYFAFGSCLTQ